MKLVLSLYLWGCGLWTLGWGAFFLLGRALSGHGSNMGPLNELYWLVQSLGFTVYGIVAICVALLVRKGVGRHRDALIMLSLVSLAWLGINLGLYIRFLLLGRSEINIGGEVIYLPQYPYFSGYPHVFLGHAISWESLNVATYLLLLASAVALYVASTRTSKSSAQVHHNPGNNA